MKTALLIAVCALSLAGLPLAGCGQSASGQTAAPSAPRRFPNQPELARGPYLQSESASGIVVRWRTVAPCKGKVRFRMVSDQPVADIIEKEDLATTEHLITLKQLLPGRHYTYEIWGNGFQLTDAAGRVAGGQFHTAPATGDAADTRFWVIGDSGTADAHARAVYQAFQAFSKDRPADLWLMLGDNAYPNGTDAQYQQAVFETYPDLLRNACLWPTLGNHDARRASSAKQSGPYYDNFTLPTKGECGGVPSGTEAYYAFDYGQIHFICLDSQDSDRTPQGAMAKWLKADLDANAQKWTIAFFHHPPYTKGSHDSDRERDPRFRDMRGVFLPMLEQAGVDLVLSGHTHAYERSFLIGGHYGTSDTLTPAMIADNGSGNPGGQQGLGHAYDKKAHPHAEVCVVAGSSGKTSGGPLNHPAMYCAFNELGSLVVDIKDGRLEAQFLNDKGKVLDRFVIQK